MAELLRETTRAVERFTKNELQWAAEHLIERVSTMECSESDWKVFRLLREVALERFCSRVLSDLETVTQDADRPAHDRYLEVCRLLKARDKKIAAAFDDPRRSQMMEQLAVICSLDLLTSEELAKFSEDTQRAIGLTSL